jgi:hypothetical protein
MPYTSCRHAVFDAVQRATESYGDGFSLDKKKSANLGRVCDAIDELNRSLLEFDNLKAVEINILEDKTLVFSIECIQFSVSNDEKQKFLGLLKLVDGVRFKTIGTGEDVIMQMTFEVKGLWVTR